MGFSDVNTLADRTRRLEHIHLAFECVSAIQTDARQLFFLFWYFQPSSFVSGLLLAIKTFLFHSGKTSDHSTAGQALWVSCVCHMVMQQVFLVHPSLLLLQILAHVSVLFSVL